MNFEKRLEVRHLKSSLLYGKSAIQIVRDVSFDLYSGKTLALVGESGCGKSLTALSLLKIAFSPPALPPEGEVIYQNKNLLKMSDKELQSIRGGKIAMIFQDPSSALNPVYTIGHQLLETARIHLHIDEEEEYARCVQSLKDVGIASPEVRMDDYPHQLSGGMKQRVMIAMALLCEPDILIADEPTTALDVTIQAQVLDLIRQLQKKTNMAVLLITHDMSVVAELADDVAVMYAGEIVELAPIEKIFEKPLHPYTEGLFAAIRRNLPKGELSTIKGNVPPLNQLPSGCAFHPRCPYVFNRCFHEKVPLYIVKQEPLHTSRCFLRESEWILS